MKLLFLTSWFSLISLLIFASSFLTLLAVLGIPEIEFAKIEILYISFDEILLKKVCLSSIVAVSAGSLISVYLYQNEFQSLDLREYISNYNGPNNLSAEEKSKLLAEMDYIISEIKAKMSEDFENAWRWEMKLKSISYTRSRLIKLSKVTPSALSNEEKARIKNESSHLNLVAVNQKTGSNKSTINSIQAKLALYRKHRQEEV